MIMIITIPAIICNYPEVGSSYLQSSTIWE